MRRWPLLLLLLVGALARCTPAMADCPQFCECKWRGGKESAICRDANLSALPKDLDAGTQVLDLTGNSIAALAKDEFFVAGLVNLQKAYLSRCHIASVDRLAFRRLINLVELDLSYNALQVVPSHAFDSVAELRDLRLSGNPIQRVASNAFLKVPRLMRLELSDCKISAVEVRAFAGLEKGLEWLKLDHNRLSTVRPEAFSDMQSLHGLELDGNPWNCSCTLRPFRTWMVSKNVPSSVPAVCASPARLQGRGWDRLELDDFACGPQVRALRGAAQAVEGDNVTLSCSVRGAPSPTVRWLFRNRVVSNATNATSGMAGVFGGRKLQYVRTAGNSSNLTILALDAQDAGVYVCVADNRAGKVDASVTLSVSRRVADGAPLSTKVVVASVLVAVLFVLATCLVALCLWSLRKRHSLWVEQARGARLSRLSQGLRHDDHYEKIEMNRKPTAAPAPHVLANHVNSKTQPSTRTTQDGELAAGAAVGAHWRGGRGGRGGRKGRYRGVPTCEDDEGGYDAETETPTAAHAGTMWTATTHRSSDDTISSSTRSVAPSQEVDEGSRLGGGMQAADAKGGGGGLPRNGLSGGAELRALSHHVLRKQVLSDSGGSLYTSLLGDEVCEDRPYPDLLQPQADSLPPSLGGSVGGDLGFGALSGLGSLGVGGLRAALTGSSFASGLMGGTLPRRPHQRAHHPRRGSESPLLADSRHGSSGGSSSSGLAAYPSHYQRSSSSLSLTASGPLGSAVTSGAAGAVATPPRRHPGVLQAGSLPGSRPGSPSRDRISETPILAALNNTPSKRYGPAHAQPSVGGGVVSPSSYDYHAAQLERFLEEYRTLHSELSRMKETCDSLRLPADPLTNPKSILKKKKAVSAGVAGPAPLSPDLRHQEHPYWVPRSGLARRYSGGDFYPS